MGDEGILLPVGVGDNVGDVRAVWRNLRIGGRRDVEQVEGEGGNAGVSSDVNACIGVYPLVSADGRRTLRGKGTPEDIAAASPTSYITKSFASTIFIHGTNDGTVPAQSSIDFYTKLHALGVPSALTLIQGPITRSTMPRSTRSR